MFHNFKEVEKYILDQGIKKRLALANAHDEDALEAVVMAVRKGVADATLIGVSEKILAILDKMGEDSARYEIIDCENEREA